MTLARSWTRQLFGASGAALLVPGAIAGALVVLAFAGGFGRLSSLGQALSGPSIPGATPADGGKSALGRALAAAAPPTGNAGGLSVPGASTRTGARIGGGPSGTAGTGAGRSGSPGGSGGSGGTGSGGSGSGGSGSSGSGSGGSGSGGSGGGSGGPGSGGTGSSAGAGSPPPTPAPPTAVDSVVGVVTTITAKIPGPVGTVATQTLQSVGTTLNRILPLGGSSTTAAASSTPRPQLP